MNSTAGVNTSAHDIGIFLQCLLNKGKSQDGIQVIPEQFVNTMYTPLVFAKIKSHDMQFPVDVMRNVSYGTGLFGYEYGDDKKALKAYGHMGGYIGQRALMFMCPEEGFAVCVLSNIGHFNIGLLFPEVLRNKFFDLYLDMPERDWNAEYIKKRLDFMQMRENQRMNKKLLKPAAKRKDEFYVGTYNNSLYGKLTIAQDKGELKLSLNNKSCRMRHFNGDEFDLDAWDFSKVFSRSDTQFVEFFPTNDGRILAYVSFMDEGVDPIFEKEK
jgi:CubicO group peptidase (beta-lactamase class C family)